MGNFNPYQAPSETVDALPISEVSLKRGEFSIEPLSYEAELRFRARISRAVRILFWMPVAWFVSLFFAAPSFGLQPLLVALFVFSVPIYLFAAWEFSVARNPAHADALRRPALMYRLLVVGELLASATIALLFYNSGIAEAVIGSRLLVLVVLASAVTRCYYMEHLCQALGLPISARRLHLVSIASFGCLCALAAVKLVSEVVAFDVPLIVSGLMVAAGFIPFVTAFVTWVTLPRLRRASRVLEVSWWFDATNPNQPVWALLATFADRRSLVFRSHGPRCSLLTHDIDVEHWLTEQGYVSAEEAVERGLTKAPPALPTGVRWLPL